MKFWRRRKTEPNARVVRDEWLEWLGVRAAMTRHDGESSNVRDQAAATPFPEGATVEQTGPETWVLKTPGPSDEELRGKVTHKYPWIEVSNA